MLQQIKSLFGIGPKINISEWIANGATVVDVRSNAEYAGGHVKGSINIPLDQLSANISKLKAKNHPVITCCASGIRSASAKSQLKGLGFEKVHNGGSWQNVKKHSN